MSGSTTPAGQPSWVPTALLGLMVAACLLSGVLLTGRAVDHYLLPTPGGGTTAMSRTYLERVVLSGLAWVTAAGAGAGLAVVLVKRSVARWAWIALTPGTMIVLNAALVIAAMPQPPY